MLSGQRNHSLIDYENQPYMVDAPHLIPSIFRFVIYGIGAADGIDHTMGLELGLLLGSSVGDSTGFSVGFCIGITIEFSVGILVGFSDGNFVEYSLEAAHLSQRGSPKWKRTAPCRHMWSRPVGGEGTNVRKGGASHGAMYCELR